MIYLKLSRSKLSTYTQQLYIIRQFVVISYLSESAPQRHDLSSSREFEFSDIFRAQPTRYWCRDNFQMKI